MTKSCLLVTRGCSAPRVFLRHPPTADTLGKRLHGVSATPGWLPGSAGCLGQWGSSSWREDLGPRGLVSCRPQPRTSAVRPAATSQGAEEARRAWWGGACPGAEASHDPRLPRKYDPLLMPLCSLFGEMEKPYLTFVTPACSRGTILGGRHHPRDLPQLVWEPGHQRQLGTVGWTRASPCSPEVGLHAPPALGPGGQGGLGFPGTRGCDGTRPRGSGCVWAHGESAAHLSGSHVALCSPRSRAAPGGQLPGIVMTAVACCTHQLRARFGERKTKLRSLPAASCSRSHSTLYASPL